jgi:GNAT superfamily N-acetyltransferase
MDDPSKYRVAATLRDGTAIIIRAIHPNDSGPLRERFVDLSPESVRLRFHGLRRSPSESEASQFSNVDFVNHVALVATLGTGPEQLIAGGRYIVCDEAPKGYRAEIAFLVLDEYQGKGIGSLLLQHLAIIGRAQGLREFQADVLADNHHMLKVFDLSGFPITRSTDVGVIRLLLTIAVAPGSVR